MPIVIWSDRVGRKKVLIQGYALFALYGQVFVLVDTSEGAFISTLSRVHLRGTCLDIYYCSVGIAAFQSSLIAGWLWTEYGPDAAFIFGAAAAIQSTIALMMAKNGIKAP